VHHPSSIISHQSSGIRNLEVENCFLISLSYAAQFARISDDRNLPLSYHAASLNI
jgi:hypothetical protein